MRTTQHQQQHRHDCGPGRPGASASTTEIIGWTSGALPPDLYQGAPGIEVDGDEILVVGDVGSPAVPDGLDAEGTAAAERSWIARFREDTRDRRISVARQAEERYGRPISWGATAGSTTEWFTTVTAPVGTRLALEQRRVLDRLVAAGVATHRGQALAWCVDLVQQNEAAWLSRLDEALKDVEQAAAEAPGGS